jgi:uncharacterized protein YjbJ (UPF0337 family)
MASHTKTTGEIGECLSTFLEDGGLEHSRGHFPSFRVCTRQGNSLFMNLYGVIKLLGALVEPYGKINREKTQMNWEQVEGKWKQYTGKVKEKWGKLTDDDLQQIAGKRDQLAGKLQERYGIAKEAAEKQIDEFSRSLETADAKTMSKGQGGSRL